VWIIAIAPINNCLQFVVTGHNQQKVRFSVGQNQSFHTIVSFQSVQIWLELKNFVHKKREGEALESQIEFES